MSMDEPYKRRALEMTYTTSQLFVLANPTGFHNPEARSALSTPDGTNRADWFSEPPL